jgi:hypothetical protein
VTFDDASVPWRGNDDEVVYEDDTQKVNSKKMKARGAKRNVKQMMMSMMMSIESVVGFRFRYSSAATRSQSLSSRCRDRSRSDDEDYYPIKKEVECGG